MLTIHHAPGVLAAPDLAAGHLHHLVAADDRERQAGLQVAVLLLELLVLVRVAVREAVDLDAVRLDVVQDAALQRLHLLRRERVRLPDHQYDVHLLVHPPQQIDVELAQAVTQSG